MKKFLIGGVAALAMTGVAAAADLPARKGPVFAPALAPVFSWTGFYAGLNAGYGFGRNNATTIGTPGFLALAPVEVPNSLRVGGDGFVGGGQVGYNAQFGQVVVGLEADLQYAWGGRASSFVGPLGVITSAGRDDGYLGTVRARLGFAADRFLIYATGGLAYGSFDTALAVGTAAGAGGPLWGGSSDSVRAGWAAGAGVEYAITNNWTVKLEGLYYDLGRKTITAGPLNAAAAGFGGGGVAYQARVQNNGTILRAGVNYKF
jgi:outer membrane immunogenic protein